MLQVACHWASGSSSLFEALESTMGFRLSELCSHMFRQGYPARAAQPAIGPESRSSRRPGSGFCCLAEVQHVEGRVAYAVHPIASCRVFLNLGRFVPRRTLELLSSSVASCRKPKLCRLSLYACVSSESRSWRHAKAFSCPADSQCPRAPKAHGASWVRSLLPRTRSQRPALEYRASPKAPALVRLYIHLWPAPRGNPAASVWG